MRCDRIYDKCLSTAKVSIYYFKHYLLQKIPMKFRRMHLHKDKASQATLRLEELPNVSWKVGVRRDAGEILLKLGWEKFLEDNMVGTIIGLMLTYEGNMTFSVARYKSLGSRMLGLPKNAKRKWSVGAGCSNANTTFMRYVTNQDHTQTMVGSNTEHFILLRGCICIFFSTCSYIQ